MLGKPRSHRSIEHVGLKRRALGWTILAFGMIVAGVWAVSRWWNARYTMGDWTFYCCNGQVVVRSFGRHREGWSFLPNPETLREFNWKAEPIWERSRTFGVDAWVITYAEEASTFPVYFAGALVLWPVPLLLWTPAAILLRSSIRARRQAMSNTCAKCGYLLVGLGPQAKCPECGKMPTEPKVI